MLVIARSAQRARATLLPQLAAVSTPRTSHGARWLAGVPQQIVQDIRPVPEVNADDFDPAIHSYRSAPLVIRGACTTVPPPNDVRDFDGLDDRDDATAPHPWSWRGLYRSYRDVRVSVEVGAYMSEGAYTVDMPFGDVLRCIAAVEMHPDDTRIPRVYMAQAALSHDACVRVCEALPGLGAHVAAIIHPRVRALTHADPSRQTANVWIGARGVVSPLHMDPYANVHVCVHGRKAVRLYAAEARHRLYPSEVPTRRNTSTVPDPTCPDPRVHGRMSGLAGWHTHVHAGDALLMPPRMWHFVRTETPSVSVNVWTHSEYLPLEV